MNSQTSTFGSELDVATALIQTKLDELLPAATADNRLLAAARYALLGPGKRLRPHLVIMVAEALGANREAALEPACALEMIHTYSLIHDDLPCMDDDDFRRGRPTVHKAYDEATAVLAGDLLLTEAFRVLAEAPLLAAEQKIELTRQLAIFAGSQGMVGGQALDLEAEGQELSDRQILQIYKQKTSCLLSAAFVFGGIVAGKDEETLNILSIFGLNFGLSFQIIDDVLDVSDSQRHKGRADSSDIANHKSTLVTSLGIEGARQFADNLLQGGIDMLNALPYDLSTVIAFSKKTIFRDRQ